MTQHKSLNCLKGVVRNWKLARRDPEEIKKNVPMITDVQRIIVKKNNMEIKTNTLILTFNTPKIPDMLFEYPSNTVYQIQLVLEVWPCHWQM